MVHNLLIGGAGLAERFICIGVPQVGPQAGEPRGELEVLEGPGGDADVLQLGQHEAVEVGEPVAAQEAGLGALQEGVERGQLLEQRLVVARHVLDEERELGEDVETDGVGVAVGVAQVGGGEVLVDVLDDLVRVEHDLVAMANDGQLVGVLLEVGWGAGHVHSDHPVVEGAVPRLQVEDHVEALAEGTRPVALAVPAGLHVQLHAVRRQRHAVRRQRHALLLTHRRLLTGQYFALVSGSQPSMNGYLKYSQGKHCNNTVTSNISKTFINRKDV